MKTFLLFLSILICCISITAQIDPKNNAADNPALKEATQASVEVVNLFQQKKYAEALPLAQKAVDIRIRELGKDHLSVASAWRNLAYVQQQTGKMKESENSFDKAFDVYEKNQPLSDADEKVYAGLLQTIAIQQANDGNIFKAEKKLTRAVTLNEKLNGADSLETADTMLTLAELYQAIGEYDRANPLLRRSFEIRNGKLGAKSDQTKKVFLNLSCNLIKLGKSTESETLGNKFYPEDNQPEDKTIQSGVVNGKAIDLARPLYPAEARAKRVSGKVEVKVTIDETGKVIHACARNGAKELQRTSEIASYNSKFSPTRVEGNPVRVTGVIVYNFTAR
jgi:TonB family protein